MKPVIRKDGTGWVVATGVPGRRPVRVDTWEAALDIIGPPTGQERTCEDCFRPMSQDATRPIGVVYQRNSRLCTACYEDRAAMERRGPFPPELEAFYQGRRDRIARAAWAERARMVEYARRMAIRHRDAA